MNYKIWLQTFLMLPLNVILPPFFGHTPQRGRPSGVLIMNYKAGDFEFDQLFGQSHISAQLAITNLPALCSVGLAFFKSWVVIVIFYSAPSE